MRHLFLVFLIVVVPTVFTISAEPEELLKKMDGFRREVPPPQNISEQNGTSLKDVDGKDFLLTRLAGVSRRLEVKTKAECLVMLTFLNDLDPKIRFIAATAIENVVHAYPNGMSLSDIIEVDSDGHREMVRRFVDSLDKLAAEQGSTLVPGGHASLIPAPLSHVLSHVKPGMTGAEVKAELVGSYAQVQASLGDWSGATGYIDFRLDERYTVSAQNSPDGVPNESSAIVGKELLTYVFDHQHKHRLKTRHHSWGVADDSQPKSNAGPTGDMPRVIASGEWSEPATDSRGFALRGRLVLCEKPVKEDAREVAVYVELQDATSSVGGSMRLYCDLGRHDFRPEYKGGLQCELRNKDKQPVKSTSYSFGGATPKSQWVTLPSDATIRLRASPFGVWRAKAMAITPHLGALWVIGDDDPNEYFLSGTFTIAPEDDRDSPADEHVWKGTIDLPAVRISNKR